MTEPLLCPFCETELEPTKSTVCPGCRKRVLMHIDHDNEATDA